MLRKTLRYVALRLDRRFDRGMVRGLGRGFRLLKISRSLQSLAAPLCVGAVMVSVGLGACAHAFAPAPPRHQTMTQDDLGAADQQYDPPLAAAPTQQQVLVEPPSRPGRPLRPPREIRTGAADMVLQGVEQSVTREEVAATIQSMITSAAVCTPWPAVWLQGNDRWAAFVVRYDFMTRDWGANVSTDDEARMEEFVAMGFLYRRERPEMGAHVVEYSLTTAGRAALHGSPYGGDRPTFCGQAQRRLVAITAMDFGRFPCGNLMVRFTHVSDAWPTWATSQRTRDRLSSMWPPLGQPAEGSVSLNRQWFQARELPRDMRNGALRSVCYDSNHQRTMGDDLNLFDDQPPASAAGQPQQ